MNNYSEKDFSKILKKNAQSQRHELLPLGSNVMRIYDRNLEDFPVTVDLYASYARVADYGDEPFSEEERNTCLDLVSRFAYVDKDKIVYIYKAKQEKGKQHGKSEIKPVTVKVEENGLCFKTDLSSYTDSGLFLDHAKTRQFIKEQSLEKDVLNLFSYTGSFSVYAASGMAKSVTSVDLSATYTKWAEENLDANGFDGKQYPCICADALKFIDGQLEKKALYDIIIFDPPSFSNSHKMDYDFDVQRDFAAWIKKLVRLLRKGGFILFSTNLSVFKMDRRRFRGLKIKEITAQMRAEGFVKGRKGTVRSWIMSVNDDSLSLDWSEDRKPSEVKKERERKSDRESRGRSGNRYENRGEKHFSGRRSYRRDSEDGSFEDRRNRREEYYGERREGRRFSDGYERKGFGRSGHREDTHRRFHDERRKADYGETRSEGRNYGRHFDDERPKRRFDDRDSDFSVRREYRDKERRDSGRKSGFGDRRSNEGFREKSEYRKPERASSKREKPYGFEGFKPARNRNDSSDFFWNSEDIKR